MTGSDQQVLGLLPKLIIVAGILPIAAGIFWHGVTVEALQRFWHDLVERPSGPMAFRFVLQPAMPAIAAIRAGIKDARTGGSPYFWAEPQERAPRLREALNATARIILLGLVMDVIYQALVLRIFYPGEALVTALTLAFIPYVLIRGPAARIARWRLATRAFTRKVIP